MVGCRGAARIAPASAASCGGTGIHGSVFLPAWLWRFMRAGQAPPHGPASRSRARGRGRRRRLPWPPRPAPGGQRPRLIPSRLPAQDRPPRDVRPMRPKHGLRRGRPERGNRRQDRSRSWIFANPPWLIDAVGGAQHQYPAQRRHRRHGGEDKDRGRACGDFRTGKRRPSAAPPPASISQASTAPGCPRLRAGRHPRDRPARQAPDDGGQPRHRRRHPPGPDDAGDAGRRLPPVPPPRRRRGQDLRRPDAVRPRILRCRRRGCWRADRGQ